MRKRVFITIVFCFCLLLSACGNKKETKLSKEDLIKSATIAKADEITMEIGGNEARAKQYEGKIYQITGHISDITDDYAIVLAAEVDTDKFIHSDGWYGFGYDTVFHVYFDTDILLNLNLCDNIEFIGEITAVNTGTWHAVENQIQITVDNVYLIGNATYEGTYRLKQEETLTAEKESPEMKEGEESNTVNPFVINGVYYSEAGCTDPAEYGITVEEYFEKNPQLKEDALDNNDSVWIYIFASLNSLEEGQENLILPKSQYDSFLNGNALPLTLFIGDDFRYSTSYELNDRNNKMSKFWDVYKSGSNLNDSYILYKGSGDCQKIVGLFVVKYYDYKKAVEDNKEISLVWGNYKATYNGENIIKKSDMKAISQDLQEKGLLN